MLWIGDCSTGTGDQSRPAAAIAPASPPGALGTLAVACACSRSSAGAGARVGGEAEARGWRRCDGRGRAGGARRSRRPRGRRCRRSPSWVVAAGSAGTSASAGESTITVGSRRAGGLEQRIVGWHRVHDQAIRGGVADRRPARRMLLRPGHEDESRAPRADRLGNPPESSVVPGSSKASARRPPEHDGDRAGATAAQAAGQPDPVRRSRVAPRAQDAFAEGGR